MTTTSPEENRLMNFLTLATKITFVILSVTLILAFFRIMKGPSLPDRVIAIDILAYVVIGFIATFCVAVDQSIYFDIALVLALIAFLSTDRKSTRLNSSHVAISYAVFCLKKKILLLSD